MRKKKGARSKPTASSVSAAEEENQSLQLELPQNNQNDAGEGEEGFFSCYLLASLNPRFKGHTYIGYFSHLLKINFLSYPLIQSINHSHLFCFFIHIKSGFMLFFCLMMILLWWVFKLMILIN
jgi:hypothetical protein